MSDLEKKSNEIGLSLVGDEDLFKDFVCGLLGRPQTIESHTYTPFVVSKEDIIGLDDLISVRVRQQNEGSLIQFNVTIIFDDGSSETLNDIDSLKYYNCVAPKKSVAISVNWSFLIKFQDKQTPEKQEITISFKDHEIFSSLEPNIRARPKASIYIRIDHTERTWGLDLSTAITNYIESNVWEKSGAVQRIRRHLAEELSFLFAIVVFGSSVYITNCKLKDYFETTRMQWLSISNSTENIGSISADRFNLLFDFLVSNKWDDIGTLSTSYPIFLLFISVLSGTIFYTGIKCKQYGFVLFSKKSEEARALYEKSKTKGWFGILTSILLAVCINVLSAYIFQFIIKPQ